MGNFNYLQEGKIATERYYAIHQALIKEDEYRRKLSNDSILLYGILRDKLNLSKRNNFRDKEGRLYVMASVLEVEKLLDISRGTVTKIFKELVNAELLKIEKMSGYNAKRRLYIGEIKCDKNYIYEGSKNNQRTAQNLNNNKSNFGYSNNQKLAPNNTYINNTNYNKQYESSERNIARPKEFNF